MNASAPQNHPTARVLAMFVEAKLRREELEAVTHHLRQCRRCRQASGGSGPFNTSQQPERSGRANRRIWLGVAAAIVLISVAVAGIVVQRIFDPMRRLQQVDRRSYSGRLVGLDYAPFAISRSITSPDLRALAAAAELQQQAKSAPTPPNLQRLGAAELVLGNADESVEALRRAQELAPNDASILSDLAAAHLQRAASGREDSYLEALKYATASIRRDPGLLPAWFNRAVALEEIGPRRLAQVTWQQYLNLDTGSLWSLDAKRHLQVLNTSGGDFRHELDTHYVALASANGQAAARDLVSKFPQEARRWCEAEILGRWADSLLRGDATAAAQHLSVARNLAQAIDRRSGEKLAREAVACAAANPRVAAEAHALYRQGRIAYANRRPGAAEPDFLRSAVIFSRIGSPMELEAHYYAANAAFDQNRVDEAKSALDDIEGKIRPSYRALRAHILWEKGLCLNADGQSRAALDVFNESVALFASLGEHDSEAAVRSLCADVHAFMGDFDDSRLERVRALRALRGSALAQLVSPLTGASSAAVAQPDLLLADAFLSMQIEVTQEVGARQALADALLHQSLVSLRRGDQANAEREVEDARRVVSSLSDPAIHARSQADLRFVQALVLQQREPASAIRSISAAIDFHSERGRAAYLPDFYLARSRAERRLGDVRAAEKDLMAGIEQLETLRTRAPEGLERWGVFDTAPELFSDAIELRLSKRRVEDAWCLADRSRGRGLLDRVGTSQRALDRSAIPPDTLLIELSNLGGRLAVFLACREDLIVLRDGVSESELEQQSHALRDAIRGGRSDEAAAMESALYRSIIAPIPMRLQRSRLVFIPFGALHLVPFSALRNEANRYVIENHEVITSTSAASYLALTARSSRPRQPLTAVVVAANTPIDVPALPAVDEETRSTAALYAKSNVLAGDEITPARLFAAIRDADVVHFAGHGAEGLRTGEIILSHGAALDEEQIAAQELTHFPVIVLAACATAVGPVHSAEGPISVARGFLAAGARSVIATLFPVEDAEAADFFIRLHQRLSRGENAAAAVRETQIEFLHRNEPVWMAIQTVGS